MSSAAKSFQPVKIYHPEEFVDVISERDELFAKVLKTEAHVKGLLHRCVIGQVIDSKGRRLLVRQSDNRQDVGQFVLPIGGHVESGEELLDALSREAEEELGYKNDYTTEFVGKLIYNRHILGRQENHYFNVFLVFSDQKPVMSHEWVEYKYFTDFELKKIFNETPELIGPPARLIYQHLFPDFFA